MLKKIIKLGESNERLNYSYQFFIYSSFEKGIYNFFLWYSISHMSLLLVIY